MDEASQGRFERTERTTVSRKADRARYGRELIYSILDEAPIASVTLARNGRPELRPMIHARSGDFLVLHGLFTNPFLESIGAGGETCVNVTILDALVLARRIEDHTMFYRSVTIYGRGNDVSDPGTKAELMREVFKKLVPGNRFERLPKLDAGYLRATRVVRIPLVECVAKVNDEFPVSEEPTADIWSGKVPLLSVRGEPVADERTQVEGLPFE